MLVDVQPGGDRGLGRQICSVGATHNYQELSALLWSLVILLMLQVELGHGFVVL